MKKTIITVLLSIFILTLPVAYLLSTTQGAAWVINKLSSSFNTKLDYKSIEGSLFKGLSLQGLEVYNSQQDTWSRIQCDQCSFKWSPKYLLKAKVKISSLIIKNLDIQINDNGIENPKNPINIPDLSLPIAIDIDFLLVENVNFIVDKKSNFKIDTINSKVQATSNTIEIYLYKLDLLGEKISSTLKVESSEGFYIDLGVDLISRLSSSNTKPIRINAKCDNKVNCLGTLNLDKVSLHRLENYGVFSGSADWSYKDMKLNKDILLNNETNTLGKIQLDTTIHTNLESGKSIFNHWDLRSQYAEASGNSSISWKNNIDLSVNLYNSSIDSKLFHSYIKLNNDIEDISLKSQGNINYKNSKLIVNLDKVDIINPISHLSGRSTLNLNIDNKQYHWNISNTEFKNTTDHLHIDIDANGSRLNSLNASLSLKDIHSWSPQATGDIKVNLDIKDKTIKLNTSSSILTWDKTSIKNSNLELKAQLSPNLIDSELDALVFSTSSLSYDNKNLADLHLTAKGKLDKHTIKLQADGSKPSFVLNDYIKTLSINSSGSFDKTSKLWSLDIYDCQFGIDKNNLWNQGDKTLVKIGPDHQNWSKLCFDHSISSARVCINQSEIINYNGSINTVIESWPLNKSQSPLPYLYQKFDSRIILSGSVNSFIKADINSGLALIEASFQVEDLKARYILDEGKYTEFNFTESDLNILWSSNKLSWNANFLTQDKDYLISKANITEHSIESFKLDSQIEDISRFEYFIPNIEKLQGSLKSNIQVTGNIDKPLVSGSIKLIDSYFDISTTGTKVNKLNAEINSINGSDININGHALIGEGELSISGSLINGFLAIRNYSKPTLNINLKGNDLALIRQTNLTLNSDVNVNLSGGVNKLLLNGDIGIKKSQLEIDQLPQSAIRVSQDQYLVGETNLKTDNTTLEVRLKITLLDEVKFIGFGLNSYIRGELQLSQSQQSKASGVLELYDGYYQRYTQRLDIEEGQLIFTGDLDNPIVRIKAEHIFPEATVGIELTGNISEPETRLYSSPAMSESSRLAYLINGTPTLGGGDLAAAELHNAALNMGMSLGKPAMKTIGDSVGITDIGLENGSDNRTNLSLGKQLSEQLYVKYLYGIINNSSRLVMEYRFNKRFSVEASSGEQQALDLRYRWLSTPPIIDLE